jgi:hypothetical protein
MKDRPGTRPLIQVQPGLRMPAIKFPERRRFFEKFEKLGAQTSEFAGNDPACGKGLNYMSQKDRCAAYGGMLG